MCGILDSLFGGGVSGSLKIGGGLIGGFENLLGGGAITSANTNVQNTNVQNTNVQNTNVQNTNVQNNYNHYDIQNQCYPGYYSNVANNGYFHGAGGYSGCGSIYSGCTSSMTYAPSFDYSQYGTFPVHYGTAIPDPSHAFANTTNSFM